MTLSVRFTHLMIFAAFFVGCTPPQNKNESGPASTPEDAFCTTDATFSPAWTISGSASYYRRAFDVSGSAGLLDVDTNGSNGTGGGTAYAFPIRYAEVMVLDSSNTIVQCTNTDSTGHFQFTVPQSDETYTIKVNARGQNAHINVSVKDNPTDNIYYSLTTTFTADASKTVSQMVAPAKDTILGGAFNIFDQIVKANEFLKQKTSACTDYLSDCTPYTPTVHCSVYWKKGFNPGSYVGTTSGLSYYLPGENQLFILGGIDDDTDNTDTDHFDNSVIVHEYGHFIEDNFAKTDSPGGFHSASKAIDPRLAWGEGWADFFSLAVLNDPVYRDTFGNSDASSTSNRGYFFKIDLAATGTTSTDQDYAGRAGEGNFREFAITRSLWAILQLTASNGSSTYHELWATFTGPFKAASEHFRNFGFFMEKHGALSGSTHTPTSFTAPLNTYKQRADRLDYARTVSTGSTCGDFSMSYGTSSLSGSNKAMDYLANNDFYDYYHAGGALTIDLTNVSGNADLDLYVFSEKHTFIVETQASSNCPAGLCLSESGLAGKSDAEVLGGNEQVVIANAAAGHYMIAVNAFSSTSGTATYRLKANGALLCP